MSSFNSLELLSQAASLVQMSEEHKNGLSKCTICGNANRTCLCDRFKGLSNQNTKCIQSQNSAFSRNIIKPNPIKYNITNRGPYTNTPGQDVDDHFRKSLGSKYEPPQNSDGSYTIQQQRNASVEDHFTRSLGKGWQEKLQMKTKS
ncbi:hypothetical protein ACHWQZ_G009345 [Mnemiopsis leidyi]